MTSSSLSACFLAQRHSLDTNASQDLDGEDAVSLQQALLSICENTEKKWPAIVQSRNSFVSRLALEHDEAAILSMSPDVASDIFLGFACADGNPHALRAFDETYLTRLPKMLSHMKLSVSMLDEIAQVVRMKLLVGDETGPPKIAGYANRGKLSGMVQVVATRAAISMMRKQKPEVGEDKLIAIAAPNTDLGLHYMKEQYRAAFKQCFEVAVAKLSSRDRNLLRLHLLDKVTLDKLAQIYGVHRATVVRWLSRARQELFSTTKNLLHTRLHIESAEFEDLMHMIQSNLDLSARRMLASTSASTPVSESPQNED